MFDKINSRSFLAMAIIAPIIIAFIFCFSLYPMVNMEMKDMPVAIVSQDAGVTTPVQSVNAGETLLQNIENVDKENEAIKITVLDDKDEALKKAEDGDFCAVIVIPENFTQLQMTMTSDTPQAPELELYINQGSFGMMGTMMETAMTAMVDQMGEMMKPQVAAAFASAGINITQEQLAYYDAPVISKVEHINPVDNMGSGLMSANGHVLAGMMAWMATLIGTVMLYLFNKKHGVTDVKESAKKINIQVCVGLASSALVAITLALILKYIIGFDINVGYTFGYLIFAVFGIMMLLLGVMRWLGFGGLALAALAMFLSMGAMYAPYEALPGFWQTWIYPWAPIRNIGQGLQEVFLMGGSWFNPATVKMIILAAIGLALSYLSLLKKAKA